jgi:hypothetical protein
MRIDRHAFLVLTAALAADACDSQPPPAVPLSGVIDVPTSVAPSRLETPDASTPTMADAERASRGADAGPPTTDGNASGDDTCATANAQGGTTDCSQLRAPPGPSCESFEDTRSECEEMKRVFKPAVAERATRCLLARSGSRALCQFGVSASCISSALRASCADPSTSAECTRIVHGCSSRGVATAAPKLSVAECQGALSGVSPQNRGAMLGCMSEGCTAGYCMSWLH